MPTKPWFVDWNALLRPVAAPMTLCPNVASFGVTLSWENAENSVFKLPAMTVVLCKSKTGLRTDRLLLSVVEKAKADCWD